MGMRGGLSELARPFSQSSRQALRTASAYPFASARISCVETLVLFFAKRSTNQFQSSASMSSDTLHLCLNTLILSLVFIFDGSWPHGEISKTVGRPFRLWIPDGSAASRVFSVGRLHLKAAFNSRRLDSSSLALISPHLSCRKPTRQYSQASAARTGLKDARLLLAWKLPERRSHKGKR